MDPAYFEEKLYELIEECNALYSKKRKGRSWSKKRTNTMDAIAQLVRNYELSPGFDSDVYHQILDRLGGRK